MTGKQKARLFFGFFVGIGFFACLGFLFFQNIPDSNREVLITLTGSLGGSFVTIIAFYFGDSDGHD